MEKVQFQLEQTLPELKDLHEKGLFTKVGGIRFKGRVYRGSLLERDQPDHQETNSLRNLPDQTRHSQRRLLQVCRVRDQPRASAQGPLEEIR